MIFVVLAVWTTLGVMVTANTVASLIIGALGFACMGFVVGYARGAEDRESDAISCCRDDDKTTILTEERLEAWKQAAEITDAKEGV